MGRIMLFAAAVVLSVSSASAQNWAQKMFTETKHNFGTVAKDAKTEYSFEFTNLYRDNVHIAHIRTSCGCTTPLVTNNTVKSLEKGQIIAHFNTDRFIGKRGATLTVVIDRPQPAEVQLRVDGVIRSDIQVRPGVVNFGSVTQGAPSEQTVSIDFQGSANFEVTGVRCESPYVEAKVLQPASGAKRRSYQLSVRLKDDAPAGYVQDRVTVLTSDPTMPQLPVAVEGRVMPEITASPASLVLGAVPLGQKVTKQFVLQAKKPFHIVSITCDDPSFELSVPSDAKNWHLVPITFTAKDAGKLSRTIRIETDLGSSIVTEVPVFGEVIALANK